MITFQVTFGKRKQGLLKKAAELGKLCGVKVCIMFSDLSENYHYFSNTSEIVVHPVKPLRKPKTDPLMYTYSIDDVSGL